VPTTGQRAQIGIIDSKEIFGDGSYIIDQLRRVLAGTLTLQRPL